MINLRGRVRQYTRASQPTLTDQRCFVNSRSAVIYQLIESPRVTVRFPGNGPLAIPVVYKGRSAVRCYQQQSRRRRYSPDERRSNSRKPHASVAILYAVIHSDDASLCFDLPFNPKFVYTTSGSFLANFHRQRAAASLDDVVWRAIGRRERPCCFA